MSRHPWESSYPRGVSWDTPAPVLPIESHLAAAAARWPERIAIDFCGRVLSFRELHDAAARAAKGFQELGVGPTVNVGLHLANTPHFIICFFAVLMAGGRVVPVSPHAANRDLEYQVRDAEIRIMVTLGSMKLYPRIAALARCGLIEKVIVCRLEDIVPPGVIAAPDDPPLERASKPCGDIEFDGLIANDGAYRAFPRGWLEDEVAVLQYTGGTTGEPKGAMLTHANFSLVPHSIGRWVGARMSERSSMLLALPLFHVFGLILALLAVARGTTTVLHPRFDADHVLDDIARKRVTVFFGVPTMYAAIVQHPMAAALDLSSLELCGCGGAPLPLDVISRFRDLTGATILEGYSLTEITDVGTWQPVEGKARAGTVGIPLPLTLVEVVDLETGTRVLSPGERGEICFSGPQLMMGYWKKPEATAEAFQGGRFHSGDIGFMDDGGYLTLIGRKKDMILCGGNNIFPRKIEDAIHEHPAVAEVAVIGVSDARLGQRPKAFITLKSGCLPLTHQDLRAFLADKLSGYEIPKDIEIRRSLPRTPVGKLSKKELEEEEYARRESAG